AYTAPIGYRGPLVVATHSVNDIHPGAHNWWYKYTYAWLNRHSAEIADAVIVVLQGADDCFRPMDDEEALRAVRRRFFGGDRPFILFVGKSSTRRNIPL